MNSFTNDQYLEIANLSSEELELMIGRHLLQKTSGINEYSDEDAKESYNRLIKFNSQKIFKRLCEDGVLSVYRQKKIHEGFEVVCAIADVLVGMHGQVPVLALSVRLMRYGIDQICLEHH